MGNRVHITKNINVSQFMVWINQNGLQREAEDYLDIHNKIEDIEYAW